MFDINSKGCCLSPTSVAAESLIYDTHQYSDKVLRTLMVVIMRNAIVAYFSS